VALTPDVVRRLSRSGYRIFLEDGAGENSCFLKSNYQEAGAEIVPNARTLYDMAKVVLKVQPPTEEELRLMHPGTVLIAFLQPLLSPELVLKLAERRITAVSLDAIPRITRAQPMDALSSMGMVAGYKAVLLAANTLQKFFPLLMTAAGTIPPAKVLVLGAGVAGLQAIATARRLGAVVEAFDTRPVVKEEVQSLGASFVELEIGPEAAQGAGGYAKELSESHMQREIALIRQHAVQSDVVITTALIPGRPAPLLLPEETVKSMRHGSVIVDLAAERGGNCELTVAGETVIRHGITIIGLLNLPSCLATHASQMFAKNISALLDHLAPKGQLTLDMRDPITREVVLARDGEVLHGPTLAWMKQEAA
jgi:NAD(P) transhydrogenase subunit alpha